MQPLTPKHWNLWLKCGLVLYTPCTVQGVYKKNENAKNKKCSCFSGYGLPYPSQSNHPPYNPHYPAQLEFAGLTDSTPPYQATESGFPAEPPPYSTLSGPL